MSTALIYARVSTEEQSEEGQSIETQIRICKKWSKDNNFQVGGIYLDEGKSATNLNRPALQDLLARCKESVGIDAILVQDTDRLARNTLDHLTIKAILKKKNIKLISISQPMIDDSPEGNLIDTVLASVNAFQSQITGRKTSKVLEEKAKIGWYPGGRPPLGYKNAENPTPTSTLDKRIVVIDPETGPFIKQMFEKYLTNNYSVQQIADWLNKNGVKSVTGGRVSHSTIDNYLNDKFYIGKFLWNGKEYTGKHEKMITRATYDKVRDLLGERNQHASRKRVHNFLLSGFAFCNQCGSRFWAEKHTKHSGKVYEHYYCSKCKTSTYVDANKIETQVEELFNKIQLTKEYTNFILEMAKKLMLDLRQTGKTEKDNLLKKKTKLEIALRDLEDARFINKTISDDNFLRIFNRYNEEIKNLDDRISGLQVDHGEKIKTLEIILRLAENIGQAYSTAPPLLKRTYLNLFFKKFEVKKGKIVKYTLTDGVKELIENGSIRVTTNGLPRVDSDHEPTAYKKS